MRLHRPHHHGHSGHGGHGRRHGSRRLFHRIVMHGLILLGLEALAIAVVLGAYNRVPQWRTDLENLATHLTRAEFAMADQPQQMQASVEELRRTFDLEVSIYRPDGTLLATNIDPPLPPISPAELDSLQGRSMLKHGRPFRVIAPAVIDGKLVGYSVSQRPRREADLLRGVLIGVAVLFVLGSASIPLARSVSSPLERLTRAAQALGRGDLSTRADIRCSSVREVGELAEAFDEMAARLELLVRNEKELIANVSHELRTPMARIRIALELASEGDMEQARRALAEIGVDLAELERLVEDTLATARLDLAVGKSSASPPLRKERVNAEDILHKAVSRFRSAHPERELNVNVTLPLPELEADAALLRRVVENVVDNARKYSDASIDLRARGTPEGLLVEVEDRGIGMDEADQQRLFTPFFRSDRSRSRGTGGVGLGLALSRRIVEAHGGSIKVESTLGKGTTVRFVVPTV